MADITGKRVIMIIAPQNFRDEELINTREEIERAGGAVTVASTSTDIATGMFGASAKPDIILDKVQIDKYDAVIFIGGSGSEIYFDHTTAQQIAREAYSKNKLLTAICIAPSILAKANLLKGKRATVWAGDKYINILRSMGADYTGESVTQDGRIITANGPEAAREFGKTIVNNL
ncbi:MAG: DJ-1/PfpI family protein [Thermoplasmata archaeon]|nr:DJ-1/PfpI family protein [Thermoplasmata archaeon]